MPVNGIRAGAHGVIAYIDCETASATVHFGRPTEDELAARVSCAAPVHGVGAFTLDGLVGWCIDKIEDDPSNAIGTSLPLMPRPVRRAGMSIAGLWESFPPEEQLVRCPG